MFDLLLKRYGEWSLFRVEPPMQTYGKDREGGENAKARVEWVGV